MNARLFLLPLVVAVALLAAGCGGGGGSAKPGEDDVATVGSVHLTKTRLQAELARAKASLVAQGQKFPKEGTTEYESLKAQAIWLLVMEAAREAEADKLGLEVTDKEVDERIASIRKQYFSGSNAKYLAELKKEGLTEDEARHLVKALIVSEKLQKDVTKDTKVTNADVHAYFLANKAQYPAQREVQYILVGKNKEALAQQIYDQLKKGGDFAALAKKYSQDPSTKNSAGKLTAKKGELVPNFDKVAFELKAGELAKPVNTPEYGWFVLKAVTPVKETTEKDVADTIRAQLLGEKQNQTMTDWSADLAQSVCTDGKISYQIGFTPVPDPCAQYTQTTATTTG